MLMMIMMKREIGGVRVGVEEAVDEDALGENNTGRGEYESDIVLLVMIRAGEPEMLMMIMMKREIGGVRVGVEEAVDEDALIQGWGDTNQIFLFF